MGTDTGVSEIDSASSLPEGRTERIIQKDISIPVVTTSTSEVGTVATEIVVRGLVSRSIAIPIDAMREIFAYKNLLANRGPVETETTASHEG